MKRDFEALQARKDLDIYLRKLRRISRKQPPRQWIRDIREALGMNSDEFARRMGVRQPSVAGLEQTERAGTIKIKSLQKAAAALECQLVYALVPNVNLSSVLYSRQCHLAEKDLRAQNADFDKWPLMTQVFAIDKAAKKISGRRVWGEEGLN